MKPEILTKFQCPECGKLHDEESDAARCCEPEIDEVYVCSVCGEEFIWEDDAEKHLATPHGGEPTTQEKCHDALFDGKPMLGQWAFEMAHETEFLIPPSEQLKTV